MGFSGNLIGIIRLEVMIFVRARMVLKRLERGSDEARKFLGKPFGGWVPFSRQASSENCDQWS